MIKRINAIIRKINAVSNKIIDEMDTGFFCILCFFIWGNILFCTPARALSPTFLQLVAGGDPVCDDCSGSLKFAWHMEDNDNTPDVTIGNPCGCSDGDTIGEEFGSPDFSTSQKSDGTYSLRINAKFERYKFAVSSNDLIDLDSIKITFDLYIVTYPSAGLIQILVSEYDGTDHLALYLSSTDNKVIAQRIGQSTSQYIGIAVATGSWFSCEYQAKTGIGDVDHYIKCGVTSAEEDDDHLTKDDPAIKLMLGDVTGTSVGEYYLDNVKVYPCDRY